MTERPPDPVLTIDDYITCPRCRVMRLLSDPTGCDACRKSI